MTESIRIWLPDAEMTRRTGASLAHTLYGVPLTVWLAGELGAGKTTLLQSFAKELGIRERLTSPTFALEQRYKTQLWGELLHIDLYRLTPHEAADLVHSSDEHQGIRCIEWSERLPASLRQGGIHVFLEDRTGESGRHLSAEFRDLAIPSAAQTDAWREELMLSSIVQRHCDAVARTAVRLGEALQQQGILVRLQALQAAGQLHDLLRFLDFHHGAAHVEEEISPERSRLWEEQKRNYRGLRHEEACAKFLTTQGFPGIAEIVRPHGLTLGSSERTTIEQKLLYYADKRVKIDEVVTLEERLRDFSERYGKNGKLTESDAWYDEARRTERELFPDGAPF